MDALFQIFKCGLLQAPCFYQRQMEVGREPESSFFLSPLVSSAILLPAGLTDCHSIGHSSVISQEDIMLTSTSWSEHDSGRVEEDVSRRRGAAQPSVWRGEKLLPPHFCLFEEAAGTDRPARWCPTVLYTMWRSSAAASTSKYLEHARENDWRCLTTTWGMKHVPASSVYWFIFTYLGCECVVCCVLCVQFYEKSIVCVCVCQVFLCVGVDSFSSHICSE